MHEACASKFIYGKITDYVHNLEFAELARRCGGTWWTIKRAENHGWCLVSRAGALLYLIDNVHLYAKVLLLLFPGTSVCLNDNAFLQNYLLD